MPDFDLKTGMLGPYFQNGCPDLVYIGIRWIIFGVVIIKLYKDCSLHLFLSIKSSVYIEKYVRMQNDMERKDKNVFFHDFHSKWERQNCMLICDKLSQNYIQFMNFTEISKVGRVR